jgi:hypothetical protein
LWIGEDFREWMVVDKFHPLLIIRRQLIGARVRLITGAAMKRAATYIRRSDLTGDFS